MEEVLEKIHENAEAVDGDGVNKDPLRGIDDILEIIEAGTKTGIEF